MARVSVAKNKFVRSHEKSGFEILEIEEALARVYKTDAHCVCYVSEERLKKEDELTRNVLLESWFFDVDCKAIDVPLAIWAGEQQARASEVFGQHAWYVTRGGLRLVVAASRGMAPQEYERTHTVWRRALAKAGVEVDPLTTDWTRFYRLPQVVRDGVSQNLPRDVPPMSGVSPPESAHVARRSPSHVRVVDVVFRNDLDSQYDSLQKRIAELLPSEGGEWHRLFMALAGALLRRGVAPEQVPLLISSASEHSGHDDRPRRLEAETTVRRYLGGGHIISDGYLRQYHPRLLRVLGEPVPLTPDPVLELDKALAEPRDGITEIQAPCGTGKTRAAERRIRRHLDENPKRRLVWLVPRNDLAREMQARLSEHGHETVRLIAPISHLDRHGALECIHEKRALPLVEAGLPLHETFCDPKGGPRCTNYDGCRARLGSQGPPDARVIIATHQKAPEALSAAKTATVLVDEPPPGFLTVTLEKAVLAEALHRRGMLGGKWGEKLPPILERLSLVAPGEPARIREVVGDFSVPHLEHGRLPVERWELALARSSDAASELLGRVLRVYYMLYLTLRCAGWVSVTEAGVVLGYVPEHTEKLLRHEGPVVLLDANPELRRPEYARIQDGVPHFQKRVESVDGVRIRRILLRTRGAVRGHWVFGTELNYEDGTIELAMERALNLARGCKRIGLVCWKVAHDSRDFIALIDRIAGPSVECHVRYYYALRGKDDLAHCDGLITFGDPFKTQESVALTAAALNIAPNERADLEAEAELEQAHGRLRTVHRATPATAIHVGRVLPGGPGWAKCEVVENEIVESAFREPSIDRFSTPTNNPHPIHLESIAGAHSSSVGANRPS